ncbi:LysR substrate-binding domain-containing protein [Streptomyces virginiae]|uniref:LysR substrate-binding domain-containing protein n=1 Tax=Streptomyces virginiae TaxID=1961 RepID=UPI0036CFDD9B
MLTEPCRAAQGLRGRAPGVSLRVLVEEWEAGPALREGRIDLENGAIDHVGPESRVEELVTLRMAAGVRVGHPLAEGILTAAGLAAAGHVAVSRRGHFTGPLDTTFAAQGLGRQVGAVLPGIWRRWRWPSSAMWSASCRPPCRASRPHRSATRHTRWGCACWTSRGPLPPVARHPRRTADGGHQWLRAAVRHVLRPSRPE